MHSPSVPQLQKEKMFQLKKEMSSTQKKKKKIQTKQIIKKNPNTQQN